MRPLAALLALSVLCCTPAGVVGTRYRGEPLFTVRGQLVTPSAAPTAPIRLAIAWYPDETSSTAPRAIVTQEVVYEGSFPLNYTFSFFTVPPPGVLTEYRDGDEVTRAAFGVLLAYQDVDGNGQLDAIPAGGRAVDRVLGTSVGDTYNGAPAEAPLWVAYVEGAPGRRWTGYAAGYNLWEARARQVVPSDTGVPIRLDATNELAFFVCDEFISGSAYGFDLPCNVEPTGGLRVIGNVQRTDGVPAIALRITDGRAPVPGLVVELNDAGVSFDTASGNYTASGEVPVTAPGLNVVRVRAPNREPIVFTVEAPGDFSLLAPRAGARVLAGTPLVAQWGRAPGALFYQAQAYAVTPPHDGPPAVLVYDRQEASLSARLEGLTRDDHHEVLVSAFAPRYLAHGRGGSLVNAFVSHSETVDVLPADVGGWLSGVALVSRYQGQSGGSVWVEAFDGVAPVTNALVTANGEALTFDAMTGEYGATVALQPGDVARLGLTLPGQARKSFDLPLPGDFTVTAPPRSHPTRTPLRLEWTRAPDASDYRVSVTDPTGRSLHFAVVSDHSATVPALDAVGDVFVTVTAARQSSSRHRFGLVQQSFDVTLTP
ncbi:MAG: hypothetical protein JNJ54_08775 [Myxococcaceae bacterium]|nr:hypothetical protein [Myxococcaceae bacterium]